VASHFFAKLVVEQLQSEQLVSLARVVESPNRRIRNQTMSKNSYIAGIFNYCDRWCERCPFTARCRLFADEKKFLAAAEAGDEEALHELFDAPPDEEPEDEEPARDEENAAFWDVFDGMAAEAIEEVDASLAEVDDDEFAQREARLDELTRRDPLVQLSHDYAMQVHEWIRAHEQDLPAEEERFRAARDAITPTEALEVISWHHMQIGVKLSRATHGRLEAMEETEEAGEEWETGSEWSDDDVDLAEIHQHDADGSARVALLGIERSLGAWTLLRDAYPQDDSQIQEFQRQLARLRRMLDREFPGARTFRRPGFDD
jgi:hypothetical protein